MREATTPIITACEALGKNVEEHVEDYGAGIEHRLTGQHETAPWQRVQLRRVGPRRVGAHPVAGREGDKKGYIEDRRPNANMDPYVVTRLITDTFCSALA